jgi:DNA-directed RNA polymerase subunit alpha
VVIEIQKPKIKVDKASDTSGRFIIEPLERSFGHVLGNSLRRILLSSIPGAAVTQVKIDGALHEFTTIPGVKEDLTDVVLQIKQLVLKSHSAQPVSVMIEEKGQKEVTAKDIKVTSDVEVINPELHIATMNKQGKLMLELIVEQGKGYVSAERNKTEKMPIGTIPVDSIFSPVSKVSYSVENTRVGQITDYDRLILNVETDGSTTAKEAVSLAAQIICDHMDLLKDLTNEPEVGIGFPTEETTTGTDLDMPIEELELSTRSYNCLKREKIDTLSKLLDQTENDLTSVKNFGKRSINEVKAKLTAMGLSLQEED